MGARSSHSLFPNCAELLVLDLHRHLPGLSDLENPHVNVLAEFRAKLCASIDVHRDLDRFYAFFSPRLDDRDCRVTLLFDRRRSVSGATHELNAFVEHGLRKIEDRSVEPFEEIALFDGEHRTLPARLCRHIEYHYCILLVFAHA